MSEYSLDSFLQDCRAKSSACENPADCVQQIAPAMYNLLNGDTSFLKPEHFQTDPDHYARNAIFIAENNSMSLFALVWLPGQWTPIHDHGTWGVVGVYEGTLEERNFIRTDHGKKNASSGVRLARGGVILLSPGTVTSFVPNPDHIHVTGNAHSEKRVVSLHLYGRAMLGYNTYDIEAKTRQWVDVMANDS